MEVRAGGNKVGLVLKLLLEHGLDGAVVQLSVDDDEVGVIIADDGSGPDTVVTE